MAKGRNIILMFAFLVLCIALFASAQSQEGDVVESPLPPPSDSVDPAAVVEVEETFGADGVAPQAADPELLAILQSFFEEHITDDALARAGDEATAVVAAGRGPTFEEALDELCKVDMTPGNLSSSALFKLLLKILILRNNCHLLTASSCPLFQSTCCVFKPSVTSLTQCCISDRPIYTTKDCKEVTFFDMYPEKCCSSNCDTRVVASASPALVAFNYEHPDIYIPEKCCKLNTECGFYDKEQCCGCHPQAVCCKEVDGFLEQHLTYCCIEKYQSCYKDQCCDVPRSIWHEQTGSNQAHSIFDEAKCKHCTDEKEPSGHCCRAHFFNFPHLPQQHQHCCTVHFDWLLPEQKGHCCDVHFEHLDCDEQDKCCIAGVETTVESTRGIRDNSINLPAGWYGDHLNACCTSSDPAAHDLEQCCGEPPQFEYFPAICCCAPGQFEALPCCEGKFFYLSFAQSGSDENPCCTAELSPEKQDLCCGAHHYDWCPPLSGECDIHPASDPHHCCITIDNTIPHPLNVDCCTEAMFTYYQGSPALPDLIEKCCLKGPSPVSFDYNARCCSIQETAPNTFNYHHCCTQLPGETGFADKCCPISDGGLAEEHYNPKVCCDLIGLNHFALDKCCTPKNFHDIDADVPTPPADDEDTKFHQCCDYKSPDTWNTLFGEFFERKCCQFDLDYFGSSSCCPSGFKAGDRDRIHQNRCCEAEAFVITTNPSRLHCCQFHFRELYNDAILPSSDLTVLKLGSTCCNKDAPLISLPNAPSWFVPLTCCAAEYIRDNIPFTPGHPFFGPLCCIDDAFLLPGDEQPKCCGIRLKSTKSTFEAAVVDLNDEIRLCCAGNEGGSVNILFDVNPLKPNSGTTLPFSCTPLNDIEPCDDYGDYFASECCWKAPTAGSTYGFEYEQCCGTDEAPTSGTEWYLTRCCADISCPDTGIATPFASTISHEYQCCYQAADAFVPTPHYDLTNQYTHFNAHVWEDIQGYCCQKAHATLLSNPTDTALKVGTQKIFTHCLPITECPEVAP